jgi:hypothetical protein
VRVGGLQAHPAHEGVAGLGVEGGEFFRQQHPALSLRIGKAVAEGAEVGGCNGRGDPTALN